MSIEDILEPEENEQPEIIESETQETEESSEVDAPEAKVEDQAEPEEKPEPMAPLGALHEERGKRRQLESEVNALKESLQKFSSLRDELAEYKAQQQKASEMASEQQLAEEDPIGYLNKQVMTLKEQQEAIARQREQAEQQTAEQRRQAKELNRMMAETREQVSEYMQQHPDYPQAYQFIMNRRMNDMQTLGVTDPQIIQRHLDQEAINLASEARQMGKNPAELVHNLAKSWGYKPSQAENMDLDREMDRLEKGQLAAKTNAGGGKKSTDDISLQEIDEMSDEDLDKLFEEMSRGSF